MELRKCCNHPFLVDGVEDAELEKYEEIVSTPSPLPSPSPSPSLTTDPPKLMMM